MPPCTRPSRRRSHINLHYSNTYIVSYNLQLPLALLPRRIRLGSTLSRSLGLLEARKFILTRLPQFLQHASHLGQFILKPRPRVIICAPIQLLVYLTLQLRRPIGGIVAECLRDKLHVESSLHEGLERVAWAPTKGIQ